MSVSFFKNLIRKNRKIKAVSLQDQQLIKNGAEQFKKLIDRGLELPVVLL